MERTLIKNVFEMKEGDKVEMKGWVYETRDLKKVRFIVLKDMSGRMQVTGIDGKTNAESFAIMDNLSRESAILVEGTVKDSKQTPKRKKILPDKIEVIAKAADPLPIDISDYSKTELPIRLDNRFLDTRRKQTSAIFKI
nr:aspartate--tRNA(Asn) ligase [archaeon]